MNSRVDIVKLMQIALCFMGVAIFVSGMESGLIRLANRTPLSSNAETRTIAFYYVGMILFCPIVFGQAAIGLGFIRYNKSLVGLFEKYSRTQARIGQHAWKFSELHALFFVVYGAFMLYVEMVGVLHCMLFLIEILWFVNRSIFDNISYWWIPIFCFIAPIVLLFCLAPGVLLIRFAKRLSGVIGKMILARL